MKRCLSAFLILAMFISIVPAQAMDINDIDIDNDVYEIDNDVEIINTDDSYEIELEEAPKDNCHQYLNMDTDNKAILFDVDDDTVYADYAILYNDGTLIFQNGDEPVDGYSEDDIIDKYTGFSDHDFSGVGSTPWYSNSVNITKVVFIDFIKPLNLSYFFCGLTKLEEIENIEKIDSSDCVRAIGMFMGCTSLKNIDLRALDFSNIELAPQLFYGCQSLTEIDLSDFEMPKCTTLNQMFSGCTNLKELNLSNLDIGKASNLIQVFSGCTAIENLDMSGADISSLTSLDKVFNGSGGVGASTENDTILNLSNIKAPNLSNLSAEFQGSHINKVIISGWDLSKVANMSYMFAGSKIKELLIDKIDAPNVTNLYGFIGGCQDLKKVEIRELNAPKCINIENMIGECKSLEDLTITNMNLNSVTKNFSEIWGSSYVTKNSIKHVDMSNLNIGSNTFVGLFGGCPNLETVNLSGIKAGNITDTGYMFSGCNSLISVNLDGLDTNNVSNMSGMFDGCQSLMEITIGDKFSFSGNNGPDGEKMCELPQNLYKWTNKDTTVSYLPSEIPNNMAATYIIGKHNVSFVTDGGLFEDGTSIKSEERINGTLYDDIPATPKKEGYSFIGWYDEDGNLVNQYSEVSSTFDDEVITARYTEGDIYVYVTNDGVLKISNDIGDGNYVMEPVIVNFDNNTYLSTTTSYGRTYKAPLWEPYKTNINSVIIETEIHPEIMSFWFKDMGTEDNPITIKGLENLKWDRVTEAEQTFSYVFIGSDIDLSNTDFKELRNINLMFNQPPKSYIKSIDLSNSNFRYVENMTSCFLYLKTEKLDLTNTKFPSAINADYAFEYVNIDEFKFDNVYLPNVERCMLMFYGCNIGGKMIFNKDSFSKCVNMSGMFQQGSFDCSIDMSDLYLKSLTAASSMFSEVMVNGDILLRNIVFDDLVSLSNVNMFGMSSYRENVIKGNVDFSYSKFKSLKAIAPFNGTIVERDIIIDNCDFPVVESMSNFFWNIYIGGDIYFTNNNIGTEGTEIKLQNFVNLAPNSTRINNIDFTGSHFNGNAYAYAMFNNFKPTGKIIFSKELFKDIMWYGMFTSSYMNQDIDLRGVITGTCSGNSPFALIEINGDINLSGLQIKSAGGFFMSSKIHGNVIMTGIKCSSFNDLSGAFSNAVIDGNILFNKVIIPTYINNPQPPFMNSSIGGKVDFSESVFNGLPSIYHLIYNPNGWGNTDEIIFDNASFPDVVTINDAPPNFYNQSFKKISMKNTSFPSCININKAFSGTTVSEINMSGASFPVLESANNVFNGFICSGDVDLSNINLSSAKNLDSFMSGATIDGNLDVSGINIESVEDVSNMFKDTVVGGTFDADNFKLQLVQTADNMFNNFSSDGFFDMTDNNLDNLKSAQSMFDSCTSIRSIDISDSSNVNITNAFINAPKLAEVHLGEGFTNSESAFSKPNGIIENFPQHENIIDRIDGNWYMPNGNVYTLENDDTIPSNQAGDYYVVSHINAIFDCGDESENTVIEVPYKAVLNEIPEANERKGYSFSDWITEDDESVEKFKNKEIDSDIKFIAQYEANKYMITLNPGDDAIIDGDSEIEVTYDSYYGDLPIPAKPGYEFIGWFMDNEDGEQINSDTLVEITDDTILYARYEAKKYHVTINFDNGSEIEIYEANYGDKITEPEDPEKDGYKFVGWYLGNEKYDFDMEITEDIELVAKYEKIEDENKPENPNPENPEDPKNPDDPDDGDDDDNKDTPDTPTPSTPTVTSRPSSISRPNYDDVTRTDYYYNEITNAINKGYIDPETSRHFGSHDAINRGATAKLFYKLISNKTYIYKNTFEDVAENTKYAKEITWANDNNAMIGYDNGNFGPEDSLTREQFVLVLYRIYRDKNKAYDWDHSMLNEAEKVSSWARDAMCWAVAEGIIKGNENGELMAQEAMQKCDVAVIINRCEKAFIRVLNG